MIHVTEAEPKIGGVPQAFSTYNRPEKEVQGKPAFTVMFSPDTPMREIHDAVIQTVLRYTHGNRSRAAQLLQINPRTIRRHLGKKDPVGPATLAG
jgi:DNA-binding protein Fis